MRSVLRWLARHRVLTVLALGAAGAVVRVTLRPAAPPVRPAPPIPLPAGPASAGPVVPPGPAAPARRAPAAAVGPVPTDEILPERAGVSPEQPQPGEHPGSVLALPDGSAPAAEYVIKGNTGSMRCHGPESPYYARTNAQLWFRTESEAEAAGFRPWRPSTQQRP